MEIILKKTKLTKSILVDQTIKSTYIDLKVGEILGWCIIKGLKYLVCYRSDTYGLSKYPLFKEIKKQENTKKQSNVKEYNVEISLGGNYISHNYVFENETDADEFIRIFKKAKMVAEARGQFFI